MIWEPKRGEFLLFRYRLGSFCNCWQNRAHKTKRIRKMEMKGGLCFPFVYLFLREWKSLAGRPVSSVLLNPRKKSVTP